MKRITHSLQLMLVILTTMTIASSCRSGNADKEKYKAISSIEWGVVDGKKVSLYTLTNHVGTEVKITNYGGVVTAFITTDKAGKKSSIVIGFDSLSGYLKKPPYFGALIGRYGNRIGNAKFTIDGVNYQLAANDGKNHLHGGVKGFDKVLWNAAIISDTVPSLMLSYVSKDGEEGYPGNLSVNVQYTLTDKDELMIEYNATTDKATPVNLTNHSYFNLTGDVNNTILDHILSITADNYTPVDSTLITTGEIAKVTGTPFDFSTAKKIGRDINLVKGGYDHNWVLNKNGASFEKVAVLSDSTSGRSMEVYTTEPGLQFYTGNFLDGTFINRDGKHINQHTALCLETQHYPDSPNKPNFPSTILKPGEKYHTITMYKVSVNK